ncbi:hypothetical protein [Pseudotabrizicola algicola]|uniref:Uncharacterized protein n=1 Tax=Pseudotabrizicola algicola TaxID=2709381 RepID=A0A6B3RQE6_9RHOB|nr:hypothetical protein [Pseudotabrizicola algicola]NEX47473.1 hypothetical protein [Pseudotabrizicola algicola]
MTHFSRIVLPQDLEDSAKLRADLAFLRRMDALTREAAAKPAAKPGLFVAGARRKSLFH